MESYRGWRLQAGKLVSYAHESFWEGTTKEAICAHGCDVGECLEKHPTCTCGIYSIKNLAELLGQYPGMDIYGVIYNHGVVHEGEKGIRSERATIRALFTADFTTGAILAKNYPGVAIMVPPPEILALQKRVEREYDWQGAMMRKRARDQERKQLVVLAKASWPDGPEAEKKRLMALLKGANREKIIEFAKEYASTDEWAARNWQGHIEKRTKKAKPGDMVFEANDDTHPYVFIGSTRPNPQASMRFLFDRNGILVKRPNIRRWDEEPGLMAARKQAIEEWE